MWNLWLEFGHVLKSYFQTATPNALDLGYHLLNLIMLGYLGKGNLAAGGVGAACVTAVWCILEGTLSAGDELFQKFALVKRDPAGCRHALFVACSCTGGFTLLASVLLLCSPLYVPLVFSGINGHLLDKISQFNLLSIPSIWLLGAFRVIEKYLFFQLSVVRAAYICSAIGLATSAIVCFVTMHLLGLGFIMGPVGMIVGRITALTLLILHWQAYDEYPKVIAEGYAYVETQHPRLLWCIHNPYLRHIAHETYTTAVYVYQLAEISLRKHTGIRLGSLSALIRKEKAKKQKYRAGRGRGGDDAAAQDGGDQASETTGLTAAASTGSRDGGDIEMQQGVDHSSGSRIGADVTGADDELDQPIAGTRLKPTAPASSTSAFSAMTSFFASPLSTASGLTADDKDGNSDDGEEGEEEVQDGEDVPAHWTGKSRLTSADAAAILRRKTLNRQRRNESGYRPAQIASRIREFCSTLLSKNAFRYVILAVPCGVNMVVENWWIDVLPLVVTVSMGTVPLDCVVIIMFLTRLCYVCIALPISITATRRVSLSLEGSSPTIAIQSAFTSILLGFVASLLYGGALYLLSRFLGTIFTFDAAVAYRIWKLEYYIPALQVGVCVSECCKGVMRAMHRQRQISAFCLFSIYIVGTALSCYLAYFTSPRTLLPGFFIGLCSGLGIMASVCLLFVGLLTDWEREVRRARVRLDHKEEGNYHAFCLPRHGSVSVGGYPFPKKDMYYSVDDLELVEIGIDGDEDDEEDEDEWEEEGDEQEEEKGDDEEGGEVGSGSGRARRADDDAVEHRESSVGDGARSRTGKREVEVEMSPLVAAATASGTTKSSK